MKTLIMSAFIGLTMLAFTGCTQNTTKEVDTKCSADTKCSGGNAKNVTPAKKCGN
jgi:hypothetical protein